MSKTKRYIIPPDKVETYLNIAGREVSEDDKRVALSGSPVILTILPNGRAYILLPDGKMCKVCYRRSLSFIVSYRLVEAAEGGIYNGTLY